MKLTDFLAEVGRPLAYYPSLKSITGSTVATIFLTQLIYWTGKQNNPDGWIFKTQAELEQETGLTRYEQETARKILKTKKLIEEKYRGIPRQLFYRVNIAEVNNLWASNQPTPHTIMLESHILESGNPTDYNNESETTTENTLADFSNQPVVLLEEKKQTSSEKHTQDRPNKVLIEKPSYKKETKANSPNPEIKQIVNFFHELALEKKGFKPAIDGGDALAVQRALRGMSLDEVRECIEYNLQHNKDKARTLKACLSTYALNLWKNHKTILEEW